MGYTTEPEKKHAHTPFTNSKLGFTKTKRTRGVFTFSPHPSVVPSAGVVVPHPFPSVVEFFHFHCAGDNRRRAQVRTGGYDRSWGRPRDNAQFNLMWRMGCWGVLGGVGVAVTIDVLTTGNPFLGSKILGNIYREGFWGPLRGQGGD